MTMTDDPHTWTAAPVLNTQGELLGHVEGVYFDEVTGRATWAAVTDGAGTALAPLAHATVDGHVLRLPYQVGQLAGAPRPAPGPRLDAAVEDDLYRHYGLARPAPDNASTPTDRPPHQHGPDRRDPGEMVLSREEMATRVERRVYARVRMVTYIVTEDVTFTMPVSRQEVRLEQVPFDETDDADPGVPVGELVEDVHEVVLHREQLLFTTTTVPVERVRLVRRIVEGEQPVATQLRSEQFELEHSQAPVDPDAETPGNGLPLSAERIDHDDVAP